MASISQKPSSGLKNGSASQQPRPRDMSLPTITTSQVTPRQKSIGSKRKGNKQDKTQADVSERPRSPVVLKDKEYLYYRPPAEEDMYIPPGRKRVDRDELSPSEDNIELGPPILPNDNLNRQRFAIVDYMKTLRATIFLNDVNSKVGPQAAIKPAIKNAFYIKEQRMNKQDFVEPDDETCKDGETGRYVEDYIKMYRQNKTYLETETKTEKAIKKQIAEKIPLPTYARFKIALGKKLMLIRAQEVQKRDKTKVVGDVTQDHAQYLNNPKPIKVPEKAKFKNDMTRVNKKLRKAEPIFKRDKRRDNIREGHDKLHQKLKESEHFLKQIKSGSTIFDQEVMKQQYSNPYFKNQEMHAKLLNYLDQRKPKQHPNPNINALEESQLPIPESTARSQASWLNSPSNSVIAFSNLLSAEVSSQTIPALPPSSQSPISRNLHEVSIDSLSDARPQDLMGISSFNFGVIKVNQKDLHSLEVTSPPTAQFPTREESKNRMLEMNISQATQSHYPAIAGDSKELKMSKETIRGVGASRNNSLVVATETPSIDQLPDLHNHFLTTTNSPRPADLTMSRKLSQVTASGLTQLSVAVDPKTMLPPCSLSVRNKAEGVRRDLKYPISPAFVSIYKMKKHIKVPKAQDFCQDKNIPFSSEEANFYRVQQSQQKFKSYATTVNSCFETARPSMFSTGKAVMENKPSKPPSFMLSQGFEDKRLYVPNVFSATHKTEIERIKKQMQGRKKVLSRLNSLPRKEEVQSDKNKKNLAGLNSYGRLYEALEGAHRTSRKQMLTIYDKSEQKKAQALEDLETKLENPTHVSPSKAKALQASYEKLLDDFDVYGKPKKVASMKAPQAPVAATASSRKAKSQRDPIKKIMATNSRTFKSQQRMNETLLRILERYELDKPILMRDKLDIIWDKKEQESASSSEESDTGLSPEELYAKVLAETSLSPAEVQAREKQRREMIKLKKLDKKISARNDNVNHYAVKFKLGKRKVFRQQVNQHQVQVYKQLLDRIENRKAPLVSKLQATQQAYLKPMEVEREFLDAFAVIIESGYFLEQADFLELIQILQVQAQSSLAVERAKILEFFTLAAQLLEFDAKLVAKLLTEPWEKEAEAQQQIQSKGYIIRKDGSQAQQLDQHALQQIMLNRRSGFFSDEHQDNGTRTEASLYQSEPNYASNHHRQASLAPFKPSQMTQNGSFGMRGGDMSPFTNRGSNSDVEGDISRLEQMGLSGQNWSQEDLKKNQIYVQVSNVEQDQKTK